MRPLICICVVTIAIISIGFTIINMLDNDSENLSNLITKIENEIKNDNWEEARIIEKQLNDQWKKYEKKWPVVIDHAEVDNISLHLSELAVYLANRDRILASAELSVIKLLVNNIPRKETVIIQNIF